MSGSRVIDVLYYATKSKTPQGLESNNNSLSPTFTNPPEGGKGFLSLRRLSDHKFEQYKDNNSYILYEGFRIPPKADVNNNHLSVPIFKEDLNIVTPAGSLHATSMYPDSGASNETTIAFTEFIVTGATGTFSGAKKILIEYSNDGQAPWARTANNEPVLSARKMTLLGDISVASLVSQKRSSNLRSLIM